MMANLDQVRSALGSNQTLPASSLSETQRISIANCSVQRKINPPCGKPAHCPRRMTALKREGLRTRLHN